jgi:predicted nucleotidyltransferase
MLTKQYAWLSGMQISAVYPTIEHKRASESIVSFFSNRPDVEAVILKGSCARGKAAPDSCLDIAVLMLPEVFLTEKDALEQQWNSFYDHEEVFKALRRVGKFSHVDLDFTDGSFVPQPRGWTSGPDEFELEIGNTLVYTMPLWESGEYLKRLRAKWLPYYDEALRQKRLSMVRQYCQNNLDHIPLYVDRGLYFQAFHRLYDTLREFLSPLHLSQDLPNRLRQMDKRAGGGDLRDAGTLPAACKDLRD